MVACRGVRHPRDAGRCDLRAAHAGVVISTDSIDRAASSRDARGRRRARARHARRDLGFRVAGRPPHVGDTARKRSLVTGRGRGRAGRDRVHRLAVRLQPRVRARPLRTDAKIGSLVASIVAATSGRCCSRSRRETGPAAASPGRDFEELSRSGGVADPLRHSDADRDEDQNDEELLHRTPFRQAGRVMVRNGRRQSNGARGTGTGLPRPSRLVLDPHPEVNGVWWPPSSSKRVGRASPSGGFDSCRLRPILVALAARRDTRLLHGSLATSRDTRPATLAHVRTLAAPASSSPTGLVAATRKSTTDTDAPAARRLVAARLACLRDSVSE